MIYRLWHNSSVYLEWTILFVVILMVFFLMITNKTTRKILNISTSALFVTSIIIWLTGVFIYSVGYHKEQLDFLAVVPRATISSFRMFLVNHDLARVEQVLHKDNLYMTVFSLTHFTAALTSILWVMKLIGFRVRSFFRYTWCSLTMKKNSSTVNVFWGVNEESILVADQISEHTMNDVLVFTNTSESRDKDKKSKLSLSYVFDVMTFPEDVQNWIEDNGIYVTNCQQALSSISDGEINVLGRLGMAKLRRIISKASSVNFFFLSDREDENISNSLKLLADPEMSAKSGLTVFAHVSSSDMSDIYDHYSQYSHNAVKARLKIIDSSLLSIAELKQKSEFHPVNYVDIDKKTATVSSSSFNSMVIGYGETGEEAFKFLYEFASFVDSEGNKIPFRCHVVDRLMNKMAPSVRRSMPGISDDEMILVNAETGDRTFLELIDSTISSMNYIIITIKDDGLAMQTAIDIFKTAMKIRNNDLHHFAIYVRCHESRNYHKMNDLASKITSVNDGCGGKMTVFGQKSEIYTYDLIINDRLLEQAKIFHKVYEGSDEDADVVWERSFGNHVIDKMLVKARARNKAYTRYNIITDINRQIGQNYSNSMHVKTKMALLKLDESEIKSINEILDSRDRYKTIYKTAGKELQNKLLNLARCEHIRWESSHKLMGYTSGTEKCMIQKRHDCLTAWDKLDELTRSYDCNVVDTSLKLQ